jgi:CheY-like chemotaxis protein/HPt (histidine-containing phosphotransfer) domain-containing protein
MERPSVLLVDDDPLSLQVARAYLESAGYKVITRSESIGTSAVIFRERPDIVVLDVDMPGLRGDQLAEVVLRNGASNAPALVLYSMLPESELREVASRCGAVGYLTKNSRAIELVQFLADVLHRLGRTAPHVTINTSIRPTIDGDVLDIDAIEEVAALESPSQPGVLRHLVETFLLEADRHQRGIEESLDQGNAEGVRFQAHMINGSSRHLGARRLAEVCAEIEGMARAGDLESARLRLPALRRQVERARTALLALVPSER